MIKWGGGINMRDLEVSYLGIEEKFVERLSKRLIEESNRAIAKTVLNYLNEYKEWPLYVWVESPFHPIELTLSLNLKVVVRCANAPPPLEGGWKWVLGLGLLNGDPEESEAFRKLLEEAL